METDKLHIVDENTILEISTFVAKGKSYEASEGNHDDLVMNLVMFGFFATSSFFRELTDINVKKMLYEQRVAEIEADVPPFGYIEKGEETITYEEKLDPWSVLEFKDGDGNIALTTEEW